MSRSTRYAFLWCLALGLLVVASAQGSEEGGDDPARFDGRYRLAINSERAQERIDDAIDDGVAKMRAVRRRIGRRRLGNKNPLVRHVVIASQNDAIAISLEDERYEAPRDGRVIRTELDDGEEVRLSHRLRGNRIIQRFVGDDGVRTNVFTLGDEGRRLTMAVEVTSDQLPDPVRYQIPYVRTE
jgi:hypothetical protein